MIIGEPPNPLTMAERWRTSKAIAVGEINGFVCMDDYTENAALCNPSKDGVIDPEDTIVRKFENDNPLLPPRGRSDVYYTKVLPNAPRI